VGVALLGAIRPWRRARKYASRGLRRLRRAPELEVM
jgi:hypothetical protein